MDILFYNDQNELIEELLKVQNPKIFGTKEIVWDDGGHANFRGNYVIVEEGTKLNDVTEEEKLRQFKEQAKFDLAKIFDGKRIMYMVEGTLQEKEQEFELNKQKIDNAFNVEEVRLILIENR